MIVEAREVWLKDGLSLTLRSARSADAANILECVRLISRESYRNMSGRPEQGALSQR